MYRPNTRAIEQQETYSDVRAGGKYGRMRSAKTNGLRMEAELWPDFIIS